MENRIREIFMYIFGSLIVVGIFILIGLLISKEIPQDNKDLLNIVIGAFIAAFTAVIQYFYGSSVGSKNKDDIIKQNKGLQNETEDAIG